MSPGVRTMPAEIALPMAAEIPNHTPRTCSSRPRPFVTPVIPREEASGVSGNVRSQGSIRNYAMRRKNIEGSHRLQVKSTGLVLAPTVLVRKSLSRRGSVPKIMRNGSAEIHPVQQVSIMRVGAERVKIRLRIHARKVRITFGQGSLEKLEHPVRLSEGSMVDAKAGWRDIVL